MADTTTPVYSFVLPEIDGSDGTWGTKLNANLTALDGLLSGSANLQNASFTGTASFGGSTGTAGQVLKSQGAGANAIWTDDSNTTYTAGSGLSLTGTEFANTAPDQTVVMNAGSGISVSGTYPTFTVTNSSPDQTVGLTGTGGTTISGTYPNFTINSTDNNTTYTAGTGLTLTSTEFSVTDNGIGALQLNVSGNGTNGQVLASDGDGSFSWASTGTGGNETLAQTLALGAVTGGTDISVSSGDNIVMAANSTVDGRDVSVDGTKLDGIETGATADQTAAEILTAIKTVDGSGSGLDADTVDGVHEATFMRRSANSQLDMNNNDIVGVDQIFHEGDTNTYIQFHAADQWRVVTGGVERLEVNNSQVFVPGNCTINGTLSVRTAIDLADSDILRFGSSDDVEFFCNGSHMYMDLNGGIGNFYIRDTTTTRFTFDDAGHFTATGNVTAYSDRRLKDDIQPIEGALEKVGTLSGNTYQRNDLLDKDPERRYAGVIAQEVEVVLPEAVSDSEDGTKTVDYNAVIALLVESIKELKAEVEELKGNA